MNVLFDLWVDSVLSLLVFGQAGLFVIGLWASVNLFDPHLAHRPMGALQIDQKWADFRLKIARPGRLLAFRGLFSGSHGFLKNRFGPWSDPSLAAIV